MYKYFTYLILTFSTIKQNDFLWYNDSVLFVNIANTIIEGTIDKYNYMQNANTFLRQ